MRNKKRVKIEITKPVGFSGRVNGVYFTVPATIFVIGDEYIENAERELKILKFEYTITPVEGSAPKTHAHKHHHTTHHTKKDETPQSKHLETQKPSESKPEKKNEQKDSKENKDKK